MDSDIKVENMTQEKKTEVIQVYGSLRHVNQVEVIDVSLKELKVSTQFPLLVGTPYHFTLKSVGGSLDLTGIVHWCSPQQPVVKPDHHVVPMFHAGIRISDLTSAELEALQNFLADSMMITLKKIILGSMEVRGSKGAEYSARIDTSYEFHVIKIGMGGVKAETTFLPELGATYDMEIRLGNSGFSFRGHIQGIEEKGDVRVLKILFRSLNPEQKKLIERHILKIRKSKNTDKA